MPEASLVNSRPESRGVRFERDPRWELVQRIVADPGFAKSTRLSQFLLYVSRESLAGRSNGLNEQRIGEVVFERPIGYSPREDNIVRSHASRLRLRLAAYFEEKGESEELRITIPRGSYVPVFERPETPAVSAPGRPAVFDPVAELSVGVPGQIAVADAASALPAASVRRQFLARRFTDRKTYVAIVLLVTAIAAVAGLLLHRRAKAQLAARTPSHLLWSQMFRNDQDTLIVPADSSLVIAQQMLGHPVSVADYASGRYRASADCSQPCDRNLTREIQNLRYTSIADLEFAVTLARLPEALPNRTRIRYARDLQMDDLKQSNLILAGSVEADPWLGLIERQMNFVVHDGPSTAALSVENKQPIGKEKSFYPYFEDDPQHRGLATIAFIKNLSGNGSILVVQGFTLAGTQAAAEFVTSGAEFDALIRANVQFDNRLPHFEILLETMDVNGVASHPAVLAMHIYP
jgi:hypothetical protein